MVLVLDVARKSPTVAISDADRFDLVSLTDARCEV